MDQYTTIVCWELGDLFSFYIYIFQILFSIVSGKKLTCYKFSQRILWAKCWMTSREESSVPQRGWKKNKTESGDMRPEFKFTTIALEIQAEF